jgi:3-hydroxyacyl-CoA dehydrogenase
LLEEAFRLVADGCASIEDVDVGIRDGLALRWSFIGPFETIDLNAPGGSAITPSVTRRSIRASSPQCSGEPTGAAR